MYPQGIYCMADIKQKFLNILFIVTNVWAVSMVILSLLLIQKGQLSVSGERMCTSTR